MSPREDEHYQIGRSFGPNRPFSGSEFRDRYRQQFPNRKPGSIMPHEFCGNRHVATATAGPKFLIQLAPGRYEFVDHPEPAVALKLTSALSPRVSLSTVAKTEDRGASVKASAMRTIGEKAACGVRFKAKYLLADGDPSDPLVRVGPVASGVVAKRSEIERDWWTAILFFLSKALATLHFA